MSMENKSGWIWLDGEYLPWEEARVHLLTHTLHYGIGVFEGVRVYSAKEGAATFRLQDHTQRLFESARAVNMQIPFTMDELNEVQKQIPRKNQLECGYIRPLVFYGTEDMGLRAEKLKVHVGVAVWDWGSYLGDSQEDGVRVKTSKFIRCHSHSSISRVKATGNYLNSIMALREASDAGYDDALMLDNDGFPCEGSGANLFIIRDGALYTPTLTAALSGITRRTVMELAREEGIEVSEKRITLDEIYAADEAFFTGTAIEVVPVRELDDHVIGDGSHPLTKKVQSLYFDAINGRSEKHRQWLHYI